MKSEKWKEKNAVSILQQISESSWVDSSFPYHQYCSMNDPLPTAKTNYETLTPRSNFRQRIMKNQRLFRQNHQKKTSDLNASEKGIKKASLKMPSSKCVIKIQVNEIYPSIKTRQLMVDGFQMRRRSRKRLTIDWNKSMNSSPRHRNRGLLTETQVRSLSLGLRK